MCFSSLSIPSQPPACGMAGGRTPRLQRGCCSRLLRDAIFTRSKIFPHCLIPWPGEHVPSAGLCFVALPAAVELGLVPAWPGTPGAMGDQPSLHSRVMALCSQRCAAPWYLSRCWGSFSPQPSLLPLPHSCKALSCFAYLCSCSHALIESSLEEELIRVRGGMLVMPDLL